MSPNDLENLMASLKNRLARLKKANTIVARNISRGEKITFHDIDILKWKDKLTLAEKYKAEYNASCFLLATEKALNHLEMKTQLPFIGEGGALSTKASFFASLPKGGTLFALPANYYHYRGMNKIIERLTQIKEWIEDLESKHLSCAQQWMQKLRR